MSPAAPSQLESAAMSGPGSSATLPYGSAASTSERATAGQKKKPTQPTLRRRTWMRREFSDQLRCLVQARTNPHNVRRWRGLCVSTARSGRWSAGDLPSGVAAGEDCSGPSRRSRRYLWPARPARSCAAPRLGTGLSGIGFRPRRRCAARLTRPRLVPDSTTLLAARSWCVLVRGRPEGQIR
jgi:hypothetical protein